jgi:hypothetical protein
VPHDAANTEILMSDDPNAPLVLDVPEAGAMAKLSKARSYAAAKDGSMPTIKIAGKLKVPLKLWLAKLNGEA